MDRPGQGKLEEESEDQWYNEIFGRAESAGGDHQASLKHTRCIVCTKRTDDDKCHKHP